MDVYSFGLTLFECICGSEYTKSQFKQVPRVAVCVGWRPVPNDLLEHGHPFLWALIQQCWCREGNRTTFKEFAPEFVRTLVEQGSFFPTVEPRLFVNTAAHRTWTKSLNLQNTKQIDARHNEVINEELLLCEETASSWISLPIEKFSGRITGAMWRKTGGTKTRLYRITIPIKHNDADTIFKALRKSFGTSRCALMADKALDEMLILSVIDDNHLVCWQSANMPRPLSNRQSALLTFFDEKNHLLATRALPTCCSNLVNSCVGEKASGMVPARSFHYACKVNTIGGECSITFLSQIDLNVGFGTILQGQDRTGIALCKSTLAITKRINELSEILSAVRIP